MYLLAFDFRIFQPDLLIKVLKFIFSMNNTVKMHFYFTMFYKPMNILINSRQECDIASEKNEKVSFDRLDTKFLHAYKKKSDNLAIA